MESLLDLAFGLAWFIGLFVIFGLGALAVTAAIIALLGEDRVPWNK